MIMLNTSCAFGWKWCFNGNCLGSGVPFKRLFFKVLLLRLAVDGSKVRIDWLFVPVNCLDVVNELLSLLKLRSVVVNSYVR